MALGHTVMALGHTVIDLSKFSIIQPKIFSSLIGKIFMGEFF